MEEPKAQTVRVGSTVSFICTAKSKVAWSPGHMLTVQRVHPIPHCSLCSTVTSLHSGLDPDGEREAAQPGHGL